MRLAAAVLIAAMSLHCSHQGHGAPVAAPDATFEAEGVDALSHDVMLDGALAPDNELPTDAGAETEPGATPVVYDRCVSPTQQDLLYPPYPPVPAGCVEDFWQCPYAPGFATVDPTTVCSITEGFDSDGAIQGQFWQAYDYAREYFGAYGPVFVYFMGPTDPASNQLIWELRAQRRAVPSACYPVEQQIAAFADNVHGSRELEAANSGEGGFFSISGNSGCHPLMDLMMVNPALDEVRTITMHEYTHIFQAAHILTDDRDSDYGLNSWIMEGQATYVAAKFGEQTGWGPSFEYLMMGMKHWGGYVSPEGIDAFLAAEGDFRLDDESYWERSDFSAPAVYYQLGAWAWAYLIDGVGGDYDVALKAFIQDVPVMGRAASFQKHFGRSMETFFDEFRIFVQGDDAAWSSIL